MRNSKGFHVVEIVIVIVVIALIGGVGFSFWKAMHKDTNNQAATQSSTSTETIQSSEDMKKASSEIDSMTFDDGTDGESINGSADSL